MSRPLLLTASRRALAAALAGPALLAGVLSTPAPASAQMRSGPAAAASMRMRTPEQNDPLEPMNRFFFGVHMALDRVLIRPAAITYRRVFPKPLRLGLHHAALNLGEPAVVVNDVLQGRINQGLKAAVRFAVNEVFGVFGLFDPATRGGLPHRANDFGITLARWGAPSGPYLFIPLVGPSTARNAAGALADLALNPLNYIRYPGDTEVGVTSVVSEGLYKRGQADGDLKALEASATDLYASFRSFYLQNRASEISGGRIDLNALPDFDDPALGAPTTPAPAPPPAPTGAAPEPTPSDSGASAGPTAAPEPAAAAAASTPAPAAQTAPQEPPAPSAAAPGAPPSAGAGGAGAEDAAAGPHVAVLPW